MLIPKGKQHVIAGNPGGGAKLLPTEVPPREAVVPPLVSLERQAGLSPSDPLQSRPPRLFDV